MRIRILLTLALLSLPVLTACGSDDNDEPGAAASGAFPVTIENQLGPVTIEGPPKRVVAFDFDSADAAIALGVVPVGMAKIDYVPGEIQPWTKKELGGERPELFAYTDHAPFEQVAALRPDVILATNTYGLEADWDKLNQIAPVVATQGEEGTDRWQTSTLRIGRALGREKQARRLVASTEAKVAAARKANPAFAGKSIVLFNLHEGDAWAVTRADASMRFLEQLGFELSPSIARLKGEQGRAQVSSERFDLLDADVLVGTSPAPAAMDQLRSASTFERLPVVRRGAFVDLDLVTATSIAFPSALSVRYARERIVPELAHAAQKG